jgi:NAD(P)-dependent dehydrogenase (short-subunit alcohol dehydrogenase family)
VSDGASIAAARDVVVDRHGEESPLHAIVNNAGIGLGSADMAGVLNVNTRGVQRMCETFVPLVEKGGRVVNVSSASGPNFVNQCSATRQSFFLDTGPGWAEIENLLEQAIAHQHDAGALEELGLGAGSPYGFSKALVNLYTMQLAQRFPELTINACTPGYIATDLTLPSADQRGMTPEELGMKAPEDGARVILFLLFGAPHGSGNYYGSDGLRSPLDSYRAPGSPEYGGP